MRLFSEVRGLPVVARGGGPRLGTVASLAVDAASGTVTHLRFRAGRLRRAVAVPWAAVAVAGPGAVELRPGAAADPAPPGHTLLGRRVLTDRGDGRGTVLDAAFDPETGRLIAVLTTRGELPAHRLLGLGDHALVVRAAPARTARTT
ncbi:PRC-barrel domain-containing protein [Streptomyces sp. NPDC052077]|uniref:PRC-barrel domain-containing protein n=1 Tax=Streptomyces sp. NPDC052077 TaxID=3154757 RepID=UPI003430954F